MKIAHEIKSRGTIVIYYGDRKITCTGELTFEPPAFYCDFKSIKFWDPPHHDSEVQKNEIDEIVREISIQNASESTKVYFD
jgi:hypothetical protein